MSGTAAVALGRHISRSSWPAETSRHHTKKGFQGAKSAAAAVWGGIQDTVFFAGHGKLDIKAFVCPSIWVC